MEVQSGGVVNGSDTDWYTVTLHIMYINYTYTNHKLHIYLTQTINILNKNYANTLTK